MDLRLTTSTPLSTYYIWTIGCQMNTADSERLASALEQMGLSAADRPQQADVVVLNSCVVRQAAEDKVVGMLGHGVAWKRARPDRVLALMGCMVGPRADDLSTRFPHVDVFMRPQGYRPLLDLLGRRMGLDWEGCVGTLVPPTPNVTAHVPVIHGCDLFCTFCIIPYRRGRQVSRPLDEVVREVGLLVERGVREVTLLGQTVDAYGLDRGDGHDLADLLGAVNGVDGLLRVRFLTSHPNFMSDRIVDAVGRLERVCENINLPIQSGDDGVLAAMRRGYTRDAYLGLVRRVRERIPGVALTTDVIVGFPGETEEQCQRTLDLLEEVQFDKVHVAAYSERPGTIASRTQPDTLSMEEKQERLQRVEQVQARVAGERNARYQGRTVDVLVDGRHRGRWQGRTRTDKLVFFEDPSDWLGRQVMVEVQHTSPWSLRGARPTSPAPRERGPLHDHDKNQGKAPCHSGNRD